MPVWTGRRTGLPNRSHQHLRRRRGQAPHSLTRDEQGLVRLEFFTLTLLCALPAIGMPVWATRAPGWTPASPIWSVHEGSLTRFQSGRGASTGAAGELAHDDAAILLTEGFQNPSIKTSMLPTSHRRARVERLAEVGLLRTQKARAAVGTALGQAMQRSRSGPRSSGQGQAVR